MTGSTNAPFDLAVDAIIGTRAEQQDDTHVVPWGQDATLCILADGMGGHAGGATASKLAVDAFAEKFLDANAGTTAKRLSAALAAANEAIYRGVRKDSSLDGMGCTIIGALISPGEITWISVGDSLLFTIGRNGIERLNADHSGRADLDKMVRAGEISHKAAQNDSRRNMLLSALTGDDITMIDTGKRKLEKGDRVLLASDGIETLSTEEILAAVEERQSSASALRTLLDAVSSRSLRHQDNTTCILTRLLVSPAGARPAFSRIGSFTRMDRFDVLTGVMIACAIALIVLAISLGFFGARPDA